MRSTTMTVCRLLFACFFCTLWGGAVIASEAEVKVTSDVSQVVLDALILQVQVDLWQGYVVKNTTDLLSLLQQAEQHISRGEKAVQEITDEDDLKNEAQKVFAKLKKEITAANASATKVKNEADKFLQDIDDAYEMIKRREEFEELFDKKKMDEFEEAAIKATQVWGPIYEQAPKRAKSAEDVLSHTAQANLTAENDFKFLEEKENKNKLQNVDNAVSAAKMTLMYAVRDASDMTKAAKEVEKKLGEMLQAFRNAAELAARLREEGAKSEDGQNEKGDTGAGKENGATDEAATKNGAAESTLRQAAEDSSFVDGSLLSTPFFPTLFVPFLLGPVTAAIAAP